MSGDMHDLLIRMADELDNYRQLLTDDRREVHALAAEARAALAAAPEGEVGELVAWLRLNGDSFAAGRRHAHDLTFQSFHRAADLLEQLAAAAPAVVPDGPAVPNGRGPASVVGEPSDAEVLAVRPMLEQVAAMGDCIGANTVGAIMAISDRAAAWLAENPPGKLIAIEPRGCPIPGACSCVQPAPPAEGEVGELVKRLRDWHTISTLEERARAAELLQRQHPAPVPVSERLPGDQLCWWYEPDEEDGYGGRWTLLRIRGGTGTYTHWLPAHALPLPAPQGGEGEG